MQNFVEILQNTMYNCLHAQFIKSLLVFKPICMTYCFHYLRNSQWQPITCKFYILLWSIMQTNRAACYWLLTSTCLTFSFGELVNIVFHIVPCQVRSSSVYSWSINTWKRNKPHILDYCVIRAIFFCVWRLKFKAIFRNDGIALLP